MTLRPTPENWPIFLNIRDSQEFFTLSVIIVCTVVYTTAGGPHSKKMAESFALRWRMGVVYIAIALFNVSPERMPRISAKKTAESCDQFYRHLRANY